MRNIGEKLRKIRKEKGFPQKQIADVLGLHRTNYSKVENNVQKLTPEQIALFCEFCSVSADYILGIEINNEKIVTLNDKQEILNNIENIKRLLDE